MAEFPVAKAIETSAESVRVDNVPPGDHRFQLVVEDEAGNRSLPDIVKIKIRNPAVVILDFQPSHGRIGDKVIVSGRNFGVHNKVTFNGVTANIIAASSTSLTVTVPERARSGPIMVTSAAGSAASNEMFLIQQSFAMKTGPRPVDFGYDGVRKEVWVLNNGPVLQNRGAVSILSLEARKETASILVGFEPSRLVVGTVNNNRQLALVTNNGEKTVAVIDVAARKIVRSIKIGLDYRAAAISPDGRWGYVAGNSPEDMERGRVAIIDLLEMTLVRALAVGRDPFNVVFSPTEETAFVSCSASGTIEIIDVAAQRLKKSLLAGDSPRSKPMEIALSKETFPLWVANNGIPGCTMVRADLSMLHRKFAGAYQSIATNNKGSLTFMVGSRQMALAGVVDEGSALRGREVATRVEGGSRKAVALTDNAELVLMAHPGSTFISIFDGQKMKFIMPAAAADDPQHIMLSSDSRLAFILSVKSRILTVLDLQRTFPHMLP